MAPADSSAHGKRNDAKPKREFTQRDIEQRAYGLWQADGGKRSEYDYWIQAREELEKERDSGSAQPWTS